MKSTSSIFALFALSLVLVAPTKKLFAQSGLRESLERLDKNENGEIDPDEVTPLARPYLERITATWSRRPGEALQRSIDISRLQEAARSYHAMQNGAWEKRVRAEGKRSVLPFGTQDDEPLIPGFGLAEIKFPYTQDDLDEAEETLGRYDRDDDGYIDREEAARARWTHRNPFDDDLNKDDRLSKMELGQRYARRRLLDDGSDELRQRSRRTGGEVRSSRNDRDDRRNDSQWWRQGGSTHWLTASLMGRFDANRNGRLEASESLSLNIPLAKVDVDRDGELTRDELHAHITSLQEAAGDVTEGVPGWYFEYDTDQDGQVSLYEFRQAERSETSFEQFSVLDLNEDGFLTTNEVLRSKAVVGGAYRNEVAEILAPARTVISEIEIEESFTIRDVNVHLSITHTYTSQLDAYLTGPEGQRIELFTSVGGSGDHFQDTVIDDQARNRITKGRAPYKDSFQPEAIDKKQPGLSTFNGTNAAGIWQLVIRGTRSDRFGMLHSWGLTILPEDEVPGVLSTNDELVRDKLQSDVVGTPSGSARANLSPERKEDTFRATTREYAGRLGSSSADDDRKEYEQFAKEIKEKYGKEVSREYWDKIQQRKREAMQRKTGREDGKGKRYDK